MLINIEIVCKLEIDNYIFLKTDRRNDERRGRRTDKRTHKQTDITTGLLLIVVNISNGP